MRMAHEPQMALRQERRKVSEPSSSSLIWMRVSSTVTCRGTSTRNRSRWGSTPSAGQARSTSISTRIPALRPSRRA